jgi:hypothetical protein
VNSPAGEYTVAISEVSAGACSSAARKAARIFLVGVVLPEQPLRGVAQALQVQVQATDATVADLHGGEVGVAGEGQRREIVGTGGLGIALGDVGMDRGGHGVGFLCSVIFMNTIK